MPCRRDAHGTLCEWGTFLYREICNKIPRSVSRKSRTLSSVSCKRIHSFSTRGPPWEASFPSLLLQTKMFRILPIRYNGLCPADRCITGIFRPLATSSSVDFSGVISTDKDKEKNTEKISDINNKASPEQLAQVSNQLVISLPRFFSHPHPFNLYTKDIVFIDNIRSIRVQGLTPYAIKISLIKAYYALRYTSAKVELLNLVKQPEESCIKIRWRVITKPGLLQFILFFYKFHSTEKWKDGISTMHVNKEGKIYCHVCDNIDLETNDVEMKKTIKNPLVDRGLSV